jgi:hypothetical protein
MSKAIAGGGLPGVGGNRAVQFTEVSRQAGIDSFRHVAGGPNKEYIVESKGGGVAVFDYDGDGWMDIFLVSGATFEDLQGPPSAIPRRNKLFRNNHDGTFTDVTSLAGLTDAGWGMGASAADYDNDGHTDLYITYYGQNVLYHNNGNGTFTDVTSKAGVSAGGWSTGAAWGDYDRDGDLDLYVARYIDFVRGEIPRRGSSPFCQYNGVPVLCGPRGLKPLGDILYRNNGDGTFTDVTREALGPDLPQYYGFTPLWLDTDSDGWPDLYVADDGTPNLLYHNRGDGTFEEIGAVAGCAYSRDGLEQSSMGADFGDFNHDGNLDIFVASFSDDYNTLYRNLGRGSFSDVTVEAGLYSVSWNMVSWGTKFIDYDLDGWPDLFIANGHVYPEADQWGMETGFRQHPQVLRNERDGTFKDMTAELGPGLLRKDLGRGVAVGDLDNDGDMDVVINNLDGHPWLLRCDSASDAQWILIELQGTRSNRDGLGARVFVRTAGFEQMQEAHRSGGFCASNDPRVHFGLGNATLIDELEIRWPSGVIQKFKAVKSRQILHIKEDQDNFQGGPVRITGLRLQPINY